MRYASPTNTTGDRFSAFIPEYQYDTQQG